MYIAAGLLAAAVAYAANRILFRVFGNVGLTVPVPLLEEATKTVFALWLGAGIIPAHLVFGLTEAALECRCCRQNKGRAALMSAFTHAVFGLVANGVYRRTGVPVLSILASFAAHAAVNIVVLLRAVKR